MAVEAVHPLTRAAETVVAKRPLEPTTDVVAPRESFKNLTGRRIAEREVAEAGCVDHIRRAVPPADLHSRFRDHRPDTQEPPLPHHPIAHLEVQHLHSLHAARFIQRLAGLL